MTKTGWILTAGLVALAGPTLAADAKDAKSINAEFQKLIEARGDAVTRADGKAYGAGLTSDMVYIGVDGSMEDGVAHAKHIGEGEPGAARFEVEDVQATVTGDFAVATYIITRRESGGSQDFVKRIRGLDVYARKGGHWLELRHAEAPISRLPKPLVVSVDTLRDYVGRYEYWPGWVDTVMLRGDQLYSQETGRKEAVLNLAATPESFYIGDETDLAVFVRDRQGKVTGYVLHEPDGSVIVARKIE